MSLDRSLKSANALVRHRNVLTRGERMLQLKEEDKWPQGRSIFGLPKVGHRKMALAKTEKKEDADATAAAPAAKGAKGAKGAAAIATGPNKAAAPAAKGAAVPAAKAAAPAKKK